MDPLLSNMMGAVAVRTEDVILLVGLLLLILCSSFFSSAEMAFSASNSIRLRNFAEDRVKGARRALYIIEHYDKALATILVGNNLVNIASTTIAAILFARFILNPTLSSVLTTLVMTVIVLIFGEIMPKSFAKYNPEKTAIRYSRTLYILMIIMTPVVWPFLKLQESFKKKIKADDTPTVTEEELESIIDTMEEEGVIDESNADIIQNAIKLSDVTAYDVMTPRVDMVCASVEASVAEIEELFFTNNYSRLPIYEENRDNIIGILNQKDFFIALLQNKDIKTRELMKQPIFVPENMKVDDLIKIMQKSKLHMTVVLDEYGGTSGIVTMEDCLESMVGEIYDEHDEEEEIPLFTEIDKNVYLLNAEITLEDLYERLEIEHLPETDYNTLSGFLFEQSENLIEKGSVIEVNAVDDQIDKEGNLISKNVHMKYTVTRMDQNRPKEIRLEIEYIDEE